MPESPDFEQIALQIASDHGVGRLEEWDSETPIQVVAAIAEQLRHIWNARGAVDIATVESELSSMMGATMAGPYCKNLDRALRTLDR